MTERIETALRHLRDVLPVETRMVTDFSVPRGRTRSPATRRRP